jgi:hypothetical protein
MKSNRPWNNAYKKPFAFKEFMYEVLYVVLFLAVCFFLMSMGNMYE